MSEGKPGKLAEQIICWISSALGHGDLPCYTQSLPADAVRKILFFGQLAILSSLQCVKKVPCCIEVLGSSSHLLVLSRGLLKELEQSLSYSGERKGELKYTAFFFVSEKQKHRSAGNLGQCVPHTSLDSPTHSSLCRQCCAKVLQLLMVPRVFPGLPLLP